MLALAQNAPTPTETEEVEETPPAQMQSSCVAGDREDSLTILLPQDRMGSTVAAHPTFFFYIPPNSAEKAEFVLYENVDEPIYKSRFAITGRPGIMSLRLPIYMNLQPLEVGKTYQVSFTLICNVLEPSENITVTGKIERTRESQTLNSQLQNAPARDRPEIYADAGMWLDALSSLAMLRRAEGNDPALISEWEKFLNSMGLGKLADRPLLMP